MTEWHRTSGQLVRFALVGVAINVLGYAVYLGITHIGADPKLTMTFLYSTATIASFLANRRVTFRDATRSMWAPVRYAMAYTVGYLINLFILIVGTDNLGYPHELSQAVAIFAVAAYLFLALKFFVFRTPQTVPEAGP